MVSDLFAYANNKEAGKQLASLRQAMVEKEKKGMKCWFQESPYHRLLGGTWKRTDLL